MVFPARAHGRLLLWMDDESGGAPKALYHRWETCMMPEGLTSIAMARGKKRKDRTESIFKVVALIVVVLFFGALVWKHASERAIMDALPEYLSVLQTYQSAQPSEKLASRPLGADAPKVRGKVVIVGCHGDSWSAFNVKDSTVEVSDTKVPSEVGTVCFVLKHRYARAWNRRGVTRWDEAWDVLLLDRKSGEVLGEKHLPQETGSFDHRADEKQDLALSRWLRDLPRVP